MRLHPREQLSNLDANQIALAVLDIFNKRDLTYSMALMTLASVQAHYLQKMALAEVDTAEATQEEKTICLPGEDTAMALEIRTAIDQHGLTSGEILRSLNSEMASMIKYVIREERHPGRPDLPGGLEAPERMQS